QPADAAADDTGPVRLPVPPTPAPRPPLPVLAALVPVAGAVVLWQVTGSAFALWFAALGPLMAVASLLDGLRSARRARRAAARDTATALDHAADALRRRHDRERRRRWAHHPDAARLARSGDDVWRTVPGRAEAVVVGRGTDASGV